MFHSVRSRVPLPPLELVEAVDNRTSYQFKRMDGSEPSVTVVPKSADCVDGSANSVSQRLSEWIQCFCVVTFDLEMGQSMEIVCPEQVELTEQDKSTICYLAFPDSNAGILGDSQFHFRCHLEDTSRARTRSQPSTAYNLQCAPSLQTDQGICFGYVYFRQIKDRNIRRGYFQKSVVLIANLPFLNVYREVLRLVAPEFFDNGRKALEFACKEIDRWSAVRVGSPLSLPLFGHNLCCTIPSLLDGALPGASYPSNLSSLPSSTNIPITSIHDFDFLKSFQGFLAHLHVFWELVLCNESLAVIAPTPTVCSEFVQCLVWVIWPLKFTSDYRPFFTIHDGDFKDYTTKSQAPPRIILGVTNPFFVKTLQHWPHIVKIGENAENSDVKESPKVKQPGKLNSSVDLKQGLYSEYKPFLEKDKVLIKRLLKGVQSKRPVEAQSSLIKKYYYELTRSFMIPLERYVSTLMPLLRDIVPFKSPPTLREFDFEEFLDTIEVAGPFLTSGTKGDWAGLYLSFLKSDNFHHWFAMKKREINNKLKLVHLQALAEADMDLWMAGKSELELIDLILKTRNYVQAVRQDGEAVRAEVIFKLKRSMEDIVGRLPTDLQELVRHGSSVF